MLNVRIPFITLWSEIKPVLTPLILPLEHTPKLLSQSNCLHDSGALLPKEYTKDITAKPQLFGWSLDAENRQCPKSPVIGCKPIPENRRCGELPVVFSVSYHKITPRRNTNTTIVIPRKNRKWAKECPESRKIRL